MPWAEVLKMPYTTVRSSQAFSLHKRFSVDADIQYAITETFNCMYHFISWVFQSLIHTNPTGAALKPTGSCSGVYHIISITEHNVWCWAVQFTVFALVSDHHVWCLFIVFVLVFNHCVTISCVLSYSILSKIF